MALGRIDRSYLTYTNVTGYREGLRFRESTIDPGSAPNGQCYKLTMTDCRYGIYVASMNSCGEADASGTTDATGLIQSALDLAGREGGGVVFLAPGHYRLGGSLTVPSGVELLTNRCDNHYVEYLAGVALNNDIRVGGGSRGGVVCNLQVNYGCLNNGSESKNGSWANSPSDSAGQLAVQERLNGHAEVFTIGDTAGDGYYLGMKKAGGRAGYNVAYLIVTV